ncbi:MAG: cyclase family protein [Bacillota bacterium]
MAKLIDLSHPLEHGQPTFPGDPAVVIESAGTIASHQYNITRLCLGSHHGTHLDAPYHFFEDGRTVDQIDLSRFYGPARRVDLAPGDELAARTPITVEMLLPHSKAFTPGAKVLLRTGWDRVFGSPRFFSDYPTLTVESAQWIARKRIGLLGLDTPSPSEDWLESHRVLLERGVETVIVESLANLDQLPEYFVLIAFPLRLKGRDGSPIRAVAVVE